MFLKKYLFYIFGFTVFKITQKLQSGALDEGPNASLKIGRRDSKQPSVSFTNHNDLIKTLFKVTVSSEPP